MDSDKGEIFEFTLPEDLYLQASAILAEQGTTVEEVAAQFIRYVATYGKLPFEINDANQEGAF